MRHYTSIDGMEFYDDNGNEVNYLDFKHGKSVAAIDPRIKFYKTTKKKMSDFLDNMYNLLVVSKKVRYLIEKLGVPNLEYFPITMEYKGKPIEHAHMLMNILGGQHTVVDWKKSRFSTDWVDSSNPKCTFLKFAIKEEAIPQLEIFRVDECYPLILVTQKVAEAFTSAKLSGIKFTNIKEYHGTFFVYDELRTKFGPDSLIFVDIKGNIIKPDRK